MMFTPSGGKLSEWREQAEALFFIDHMEIIEIAFIVKKARETVSRYINECDGYDEEMAFRKSRSAERRKEYQRQWDKENRPNRYGLVTAESLRREHELAAIALSRERH